MANKEAQESTLTSFCGESYEYPVFRDERRFIEKRRENMFGQDHGGEMAPVPTTKNNLVGLCLSGGGIRSATFNLGFLQALYKYHVLQRVDYLSTVSGGGYIGSCLTALLNTGQGNADNEKEDHTAAPDRLWHKEHFPFAEPTAHAKYESSGMAEREPVRHLRYFSNYLTAEGNPLQKYLGPALAVTRGLLFNLLLIVPFIILSAVLLTALYHIPEGKIGALQFNATITEIKKALNDQRQALEVYESFVYDQTQQHDELQWDERIKIVEKDRQLRETLHTLKEKMDLADAKVRSQWWAMLTIPLMALGLMMVMAFFLLVARKKCNLTLRFGFSHWFSWLVFVSLCLMAVQAFGAVIVYWDHYDVPDKLAFVSLLTFLGPRLLKNSTASKGGGPQKAIVKVVLSILLMALAPLVLMYFTGVIVTFLLGSYILPEEPFHWVNFMGCLLAGGGLLVFTNRWLNVNKISLHHFYRDRLCRAFIIQGDGDRRPGGGPFESVTPRDDGIELSSLYTDSKRHTGPYHILNANLNLKKRMPTRPRHKSGKTKKDVSEHGNFRKGESFIFSKYWCGSAKTDYIRTRAYQQLDPHLDLGTAMAISGAAANIGMGEGDLPTLRMLMGLMNIRLGYWAPHPHQSKSWMSRLLYGKVPGALSAMSEWFGQYSLKGKFINLSDGGHFDNIGVYELLRRRCKYIIVADAEADQSMKFQALAYLIRLARIDFDIHIRIDISNLKLDDHGKLSGQHCVMGTIQYPQNEFNEAETGYLFYCKASLTGDEPAHLYEYRVTHHAFPHQTTADQWFDEQQFEAYRELGYHIGKESFYSATEIKADTVMEELFIQIKEFWHPRSAVNNERFTQHAAELNRILATIRKDENLAFMDTQIYPEWEKLMAACEGSPHIDMWLPQGAAERRAGFYICNQMIQLMENVYLDLNLEEQYQHPDNRGWMNLFMHWAWAGMFRLTWAISACTYGAKFQRFCERRLKLGERPNIWVKNIGSVFKYPDGSPGRQPVPLSDDELKDAIVDELNTYEISKATDHIDHCGGKRRSCYSFNLSVINPLNKNEHIDFCFGFAFTIVDKDALQIDYFRIQDHLRQMGLGRKAMKELIREMVAEQMAQKKVTSTDESCLWRDLLKPIGLAPWIKDRPDLQGDIRKLQNMLESVKTEIGLKPISR